MSTKKITMNAILIAIGVILHIVAPSIGLPAQPDFAIAMLFVIMLLNKDYKTILICGIVIGIFTAMTTKTPGGQLPNIIDKVITCNIMYCVLLPLREKINKDVNAIILFLVGTLVSGTIFLTSLATIYGIEGSILTTIIAIVIPTAIVNTIIGFIIFKVVEKSMKLIRVKID